jgi:hypothetical protein
MTMPASHGRQQRRPLPTATRELALLGQLLDVVVAGPGEAFRVTPGGTTDLLWSEQHRALLFVPRRTFPLEPVEGLRGSVSARVYERWSVWQAEHAGEARIAGSGEWDRYEARTIGYRSDKFGRATDYEHDFGRGVVAYAPTSNASLWVIRGGALRVTSRGIEG